MQAMLQKHIGIANPQPRIASLMGQLVRLRSSIALNVIHFEVDINRLAMLAAITHGNISEQTAFEHIALNIDGDRLDDIDRAILLD